MNRIGLLPLHGNLRYAMSLHYLDPALGLPEEIFTSILAYLDAPSLMEAGSVSKRWHDTANYHIVWKSIFLREFGPPHSCQAKLPSRQPPAGLGLGKANSAQNWKNMWKVRKALHARWSEGHAAAIYLEGHLDTVYCVQFDE